jgi:hypothetical protein
VIVEEKLDHCGDCGTSRSDWLDDHGRDLTEPRWAIERVRCPGCERLANANEDTRGEPGMRVRLRPATVVDWLGE